MEDLRHFLGACQQSRPHAVLFLVHARAASLTVVCRNGESAREAIVGSERATLEIFLYQQLLDLLRGFPAEWLHASGGQWRSQNLSVEPGHERATAAFGCACGIGQGRGILAVWSPSDFGAAPFPEVGHP